MTIDGIVNETTDETVNETETISKTETVDEILGRDC